MVKPQGNRQMSKVILFPLGIRAKAETDWEGDPVWNIELKLTSSDIDMLPRYTYPELTTDGVAAFLAELLPGLEKHFRESIAVFNPMTNVRVFLATSDSGPMLHSTIHLVETFTSEEYTEELYTPECVDAFGYVEIQSDEKAYRLYNLGILVPSTDMCYLVPYLVRCNHLTTQSVQAIIIDV